jgi:hypothetical protein
MDLVAGVEAAAGRFVSATVSLVGQSVLRHIAPWRWQRKLVLTKVQSWPVFAVHVSLATASTLRSCTRRLSSRGKQK